MDAYRTVAHQFSVEKPITSGLTFSHPFSTHHGLRRSISSDDLPSRSVDLFRIKHAVPLLQEPRDKEFVKEYATPYGTSPLRHNED